LFIPSASFYGNAGGPFAQGSKKGSWGLGIHPGHVSPQEQVLIFPR